MLNKVMLIGNLGKDPEVRHLDSGVAVAKFSIATNERYKDRSGEVKTITEWHDVVVWRQLAELAERLLKKGSLVYVEGKLTTRKWQDNNGQDRRTTEIVANNFQILERKDSPSSSFPGKGDEPPQLSSNSPAGTSTNASSMPATNDDSMDDDLPF